MKARYFGSRASFDASPALDGLFIERSDGGLRVEARMGGRAVRHDRQRRRGARR